MRKFLLATLVSTLCLGLMAPSTSAQTVAAPYQEAAKILGVAGEMQEGAWVVRFPRSKPKMNINGESVPSAMGFVSWAAFRDMGGKTVVMGDLALRESEVNLVISTLEATGLRVSALHNHFFWEEPRMMFLHFYGVGSPAALALGLSQALSHTDYPGVPAASSSPPPGPAAPPPSPALTSAPLDTKGLEQIIGHHGQTQDGVFKITVGRKGVKMDGMELTSSQGLNSWAAFVGTPDRAHVAGDILMTAREVNPVIRTLRTAGILVVAVHNHMLTEQPRMFFLHYWGTGPAERLAKNVKAAFDQVKGPVQ
jgi:hypothetical protein